jgi:hypothetical protein
MALLILLSKKREYEELTTKFKAATNAEIAQLEVLMRERSNVREGLLEKCCLDSSSRHRGRMLTI